VVLWLALACGEDEVELGQTAIVPSADCDGADPFALTATAETPSGVTVGFVEAGPMPPDIGDNDWVLSLTDADGPMSDAAPRVVPWMPLHGHGLIPAEYVGTEQDEGVYPIPRFDLIMPGVWEFRVDLAPVGEAEDAAVFTFCAEG
jgi:hypothetical protein